MQLPSVDQLFNRSIAAFKRFPLALLSAVIATAAGIMLAELEQIESYYYLIKIIMPAVLGIPLFTAIALIVEERKWKETLNIASRIIGLILLIVYFFMLPDFNGYTPNIHAYRFVLYLLCVHLFVAVAPFWGRNKTESFWQYNKTLFLRILTAILFSGVLFLGLAIALGSLELLFNVNISSELYFQLFLFIGGIFNTWFFLAGIPEPIAKLDSIRNYPKGLKIFSRNVLLPLIVIYMAILYIYAVKIIIQWAWPESSVSLLILFFSLFGILALLLLYPLRYKTNNQWIKRYSKSYFWLLLPLAILLLLAIGRRISAYGITVERYFVVILGLWLLGLAFYFILSKKQNIKIIPSSLLIITFLISFGPWGSFAVSERSQINRLEKLLKQNEILINGAVHKTANPVSLHDQIQISSILRYLHQTHGLSGLRSWFQKDLPKLFGGKDQINNKPQKIAGLMGIDYKFAYEVTIHKQKREKVFYTDYNDVFAIQNLDWIINDRIYWSPPDSTRYKIGNQTLIIEENSTKPHIQIYFEQEPQEAVHINLERVVKTLSQKAAKGQFELPPEEMTFEFTTGALRLKLYFSKIRWKRENGTVQSVEEAIFKVGVGKVNGL